MDFVEGLPKSQMKEVLMVVVDRFTKFVHFIALSHPYTASKVDAHLRTRQQLTSLLRQNLVAAQDKMKLYSDKQRTERSFSVGDWVFLRVQPYK